VPILFLAAYLFLAIVRDAQTGLAHALFQAWLVLMCGSYFTYCWVKGGRTLAMKTWHLRLAQAHGADRLAARWLRYALAGGLFLLGWATCGPSSIAMGSFWHDWLAGSAGVSTATLHRRSSFQSIPTASNMNTTVGATAASTGGQAAS
jgi:uncharacterized RDD family membrane protein YckC